MSAMVTITMVTTSVLHIFWNYFFVIQWKMGVEGVGIATMISYSTNFLVITVLCSSIKELQQSFFMITSESVNEGLSEYMKIGIPNAVMLCLEWGGLEALALMASLISVDATGAQVIALNTFIVLAMIPFGG